MGIDALLKRYFPAVVLVLIGIAAYFQSSGMGQLVANAVAVDPSSVPTAVAPTKFFAAPAPASTDHSTSGAAILSRNPFDSATGPLDAKPVEIEDAPAAPPPESGDPENDPYCDAVKVLLITWSDDPIWSFAALAGGDGKSTLRRVGDDINGYKVHTIGWDTVWLMSGSNQRCKVKMHGKPPAAKTVSAGPAATPRPRGDDHLRPEEPQGPRGDRLQDPQDQRHPLRGRALGHRPDPREPGGADALRARRPREGRRQDLRSAPVRNTA
jgi:general secretion pathway protein C